MIHEQLTAGQKRTNLIGMVPFIFILLCLIWGSTWMAIKIGIGDAPPLYTAGMRFVLAVSILMVIARSRRLRFPEGWRAKLKLGYPGIYMFGLSYGLVYVAEGYIDSSLSAVLFASFPIWIAILSNLRLDDGPIRGLAWLGIGGGFLGVAIISQAQWEASTELFTGSLMAVASAYFAAHGIIIHKKLHSEQDIVAATCLQMLVGGIPVLVLAFILEDSSAIRVTAEAIGSLVYLAAVGSVGAFLMYYWLLRRTTAIAVSMIAFITPLVAIALGWLFMEEVLSLRVALGTVLILSGVAFVLKRPNKKQIELSYDHG